MSEAREFPRELAEHFGRNVLRARRRLDLSQEQLAERASLHRTQIGLVENGKRLVRLDTIVKLTGGLEVEAAVLLDGLAWHPGGFRDGHFYAGGERLTGGRADG